VKAYKKAIMITSCLLAISGPAFVCAKAPTIDPAEDAKHLGSIENFLFWTPEQQVASYRNINMIFPTRGIAAGGKTLELPQQLRSLDEIEIQVEGQTLTVDEYFLEQNVAGLLVIKDGKIAYERYGLGNTEDSLWIAFSVAKSVTSMLIGAAIQDGYIKSVDEKVTDYLPRLKNSAYDQSSIRNVLQMSSGVEWNEDYADPKSDVNTATWDTLSLYEFLRNKPRETAIWKPFGMESDANWMLTEVGGGEFGGCCINATLRDYGRLGLFAMGNGRLADGTQVLPEGWMAESTAPSKGSPGYGYFWWLYDDGTYRASGIFGQAIYINPKENVVIAMHSARAVASNRPDWALQAALFTALTKAVH